MQWIGGFQVFLCICREFVWMGQFNKKTPLAPLICTPPPATSSWVFRDCWCWAFLAEENPSVLGFGKSYHGVVWHGDDSHVPWMAKWSDGILLITDVCFEGTGYLYVHIAIYIARKANNWHIYFLGNEGGWNSIMSLLEILCLLRFTVILLCFITML